MNPWTEPTEAEIDAIITYLERHQPMSTTMHRDPFARTAIRRFTLANRAKQHTCEWCGQAPTCLYSYVTERDAGPIITRDSGHYFCNLACQTDYYG